MKFCVNKVPFFFECKPGYRFGHTATGQYLRVWAFHYQVTLYYGDRA